MTKGPFAAAAVALILAGPQGAAAGGQGVSPGAAVFIRECAKCHQAGAGARNRIGPALTGIIGRQAGTVPGYDNYSDALRQSGIVWTPENFRSFVKDPKSMVIGTTQVYRGLKDDESISLLIEYLEEK
ncbi:c-type cytochrome [Aestuariivirga litoralis]|uniref:c-type cytochrome n=1 Tax=Aestuariivirga litoralis TaxID=2650924 RepID=UPI00137B8D43|nr:c-type cytochrome [Aestuariivirga litoralis]